jgi:hypothetical protein
MPSKKKSLCDEIVKVERLLNGNGEKGALEKIDEHEDFFRTCAGDHEKVEEHETFIQQLRGVKLALVAIFGTSLLGAIVAIISLTKVASLLKK